MKIRVFERTVLVLMGMTLAALMAVFSYMENESYQGDSHNLYEGWRVTTEKNTYEEIALPDKVLAGISETVTMEKTLPKAFDIEQMLYFRCMSQNLQVFLDGEQIYKYEVSKNQLFGKCPPDKWAEIHIPKGSGEKQITIVFSSPYLTTSGVLPQVWYGSRAGMIHKLGTRNIISAMICVVIFFYGLVMVTRFYTLNHFSKYSEMLWFGLFLILLALGIYCKNEIYGIAIGNYFVQTMCGNLAMLFSPVAYLLYLIRKYMRSESRRIKDLYLLLYISITNVILAILAQSANLLDLVEFLPVAAALLFIAVLHQIIAMLYLKKEERGNNFWARFGSYLIFDLMLIGEVLLSFMGKFQWMCYLIGIGTLCYVLVESSSLTDGILHIIEESTEEKGRMKEAQIQLMMSRIQPHFIFNSLNAIRFLVKAEPDTAYEMVYDFSKYLRGNFDSLTEDGRIPFSKEMEHVKYYLNIEVKRFAGKIKVNFDLKETNFMVPVLCVLSLVENAVRHGLCKQPEGGTIKVAS